MKVNDLKGLMIAHRGIHNDNIIENTIPAFSLAINKKIPIELDIHILKDGNLVVYHDDNLKRLMGIDKNISSYTYDELKQLTFPNTNVHIPLFTDVLNLIGNKVLLVVEVKKSNIISYNKYCEKIVSILDNYSGDFVVKSFDIRVVNWFLRKTNYITGILINNKKTLYDWCCKQKITISLLKPDFISVNHKLLELKVIKEFRKKGPVLTWTICNQKLFNKIQSKADSFLVEGFDYTKAL